MIIRFIKYFQKFWYTSNIRLHSVLNKLPIPCRCILEIVNILCQSLNSAPLAQLSTPPLFLAHMALPAPLGWLGDARRQTVHVEAAVALVAEQKLIIIIRGTCEKNRYTNPIAENTHHTKITFFFRSIFKNICYIFDEITKSSKTRGDLDMTYSEKHSAVKAQ